MTSFDASALNADPVGMALLRAVLGRPRVLEHRAERLAVAGASPGWPSRARGTALVDTTLGVVGPANALAALQPA